MVAVGVLVHHQASRGDWAAKLYQASDSRCFSISSRAWPSHPDMNRPPSARARRPWLGNVNALVGDNDRADLEIPNVDHYVISVDHSPLISARWGVEVVLVVVDACAAVPVLVPNVLAPLPFLVFHVVMVVPVLVVVVLIVGAILGLTLLLVFR